MCKPFKAILLTTPAYSGITFLMLLIFIIDIWYISFHFPPCQCSYPLPWAHTGNLPAGPAIFPWKLDSELHIFKKKKNWREQVKIIWQLLYISTLLPCTWEDIYVLSDSSPLLDGMQGECFDHIGIHFTNVWQWFKRNICILLYIAIVIVVVIIIIISYFKAGFY